MKVRGHTVESSGSGGVHVLVLVAARQTKEKKKQKSTTTLVIKPGFIFEGDIMYALMS